MLSISAQGTESVDRDLLDGEDDDQDVHDHEEDTKKVEVL